jgi:hypothetical protein
VTSNSVKASESREEENTHETSGWYVNWFIHASTGTFSNIQDIFQ